MAGAGGPAVVAPLFVLYGYSFLPAGTATKADGLAVAYETGVVCTDEMVLHPDPYESREAWCTARIESTERRLCAADPALPTVLVNHYPLVRHHCHGELAPAVPCRCRRLSAPAHSRTTWYHGVGFEEVSLGYPREWKRFGGPQTPRVILPESRGVR